MRRRRPVEPLGQHQIPPQVVQTAVVLDELRLVYVPVPKAGSTTILWVLAKLAGLAGEDFADSRKLEVTRELTVHDMSVWGRSRLLQSRSPKEIESILVSDEWFRFPPSESRFAVFGLPRSRRCCCGIRVS